MRKLSHELGTIFIPGPDDDLSRLHRLAETRGRFAADTETTGLNQYAPDFKVRIVQMGTRDEAWILRPEWHAETIAQILYGRNIDWHNWVFDAISLEESLGLDFDKLAANAVDTDIRFRLIDPRPIYKGGTGHKLEQLGAEYIGSSKKEARTALYEAYGRRAKVKVDEIFREIPIDNEAYNLYAGQDVFLTARLGEIADEKIRASSVLSRFDKVEHPLSARIAMMQRIGMPFDDVWASKHERAYDRKMRAAEKELVEKWGVDQTATYAHSSKKSLQRTFEELGHKRWTKLSEKTGEPSLDKDVLRELAQSKTDVGKFALTILKAKQNKHYGDYIRGMREGLGYDGRVHPNVRPMQAATARMSISNPPIQQFPRDDPSIRGSLLADEGEVILSADYAQVEFRVAAGVSGDPVMRHRILNKEDLHAVTATALFGPGFSKPQRQVSKPIGFGRLYLGGADGIYKQMLEGDSTGEIPPLSRVKVAIKAFDTDYRVYNRYAKSLKSKVDKSGGYLVTATGRPLRVAPSYAAPNYMIQSTARDIFAAGITNIHKRGLGHMLRLVVHDEVVLSVPPDQAKEVQAEVEAAMSTVFKGIPIETEAEIKGERWKK